MVLPLSFNPDVILYQATAQASTLGSTPAQLTTHKRYSSETLWKQPTIGRLQLFAAVNLPGWMMSDRTPLFRVAFNVKKLPLPDLLRKLPTPQTLCQALLFLEL